MKRRLFNILTVLSLLLCVATAGLWVRSYCVLDSVYSCSSLNASREFTRISLHSRSGLLCWEDTYRRAYRGYEPDRAYPPFHDVSALLPGDGAAYAKLLDSWGGVNVLGFRFGVDVFSEPGYMAREGGWVPDSMDRCRFCVIPYWAMVLLTGALPVWWMTTRSSRRRHLRVRLGLCPGCGYDLRAHKPGDRCPECGTAIATEVRTP